MYRVGSALFLVGLAVLLSGVLASLPFGAAPMLAGSQINQLAPGAPGASNIVTSVVLAYRGLDTLGELAILFAAATAAGVALSGIGRAPAADRAGFVLRAGASLMFPFLIVVGSAIILHGHLTPGGGFQGGAILAAAFFVPLLAGSGTGLNRSAAAVIEGLAGIAFIGIGLWALGAQGDFLAPLFTSAGNPGELFSAGTLPALYLAVGLKVGAELAGLLGKLAP